MGVLEKRCSQSRGVGGEAEEEWRKREMALRKGCHGRR